VGHLPGKRRISLGMRNSIWEDNITMYIREIVCDGVHWIQVAYDAIECELCCEISVP
jgi:hypothetical protein